MRGRFGGRERGKYEDVAAEEEGEAEVVRGVGALEKGC